MDILFSSVAQLLCDWLYRRFGITKFQVERVVMTLIIIASWIMSVERGFLADGSILLTLGVTIFGLIQNQGSHRNEEVFYTEHQDPKVSMKSFRLSRNSAFIGLLVVGFGMFRGIYNIDITFILICFLFLIYVFFTVIPRPRGYYQKI